MNIIKNGLKIIITDEQEHEFQNATLCRFCNKELNDDRVRDHDHLTGLYRGAAHNKCNLQCNWKRYKIPVFFHNLKNYDAHLIISSANGDTCKKINVIAQNNEKFITFSFDNLAFKDSYSFLSSSLDRLVGLSKYKNTMTF